MMPPAMLGPVQVVVTALIHSQELEEPPPHLTTLDLELDPVPAILVAEG